MGIMTEPTAPFDETVAAAIGALVAGEGTPEERARLERIVAEVPNGPEWLALFQEARNRTPMPATGDPAAFLSRLYRDLESRVGEGSQADITRPSSSRRGRSAVAASTIRWRRSAWLAAVAGLAAAICIAIRLHRAPSLTDGVPSWGTRYVTQTGQRASLTLGDGTRVTLAPRTTLLVATDFGRDQRAVQVTGEAYFDVAHTSGAPFIVHTGAINARVLGTTFDVRHYPEDRDVQIAVTTGKVALVSTVHRQVSALLVGGVAARVTDSTAVTATITDPSAYTGWVRGQLDFADTPLPDVLAALTRWYGYRFRLADSSLADKRVTARLDYSATTDLLQALETLLSVSAALESPDRHAASADSVIVLRRRIRASNLAPTRRSPLIPMSTRLEVGR